jgi:hypothetical protein
MDDQRKLKGGNMNKNNDPKKPFIDTFREQKKNWKAALHSGKN